MIHLSKFAREKTSHHIRGIAIGDRVRFEFLPWRKMSRRSFLAEFDLEKCQKTKLTLKRCFCFFEHGKVGLVRTRLKRNLEIKKKCTWF